MRMVGVKGLCVASLRGFRSRALNQKPSDTITSYLYITEWRLRPECATAGNDRVAYWLGHLALPRPKADSHMSAAALSGCPAALLFGILLRGQFEQYGLRAL